MILADSLDSVVNTYSTPSMTLVVMEEGTWESRELGATTLSALTETVLTCITSVLFRQRHLGCGSSWGDEGAER